MLPLDELERAAVAAGCLTVRDEPMNRHTTFRIGGPADLFVTVCSDCLLYTSASCVSADQRGKCPAASDRSV